MKLHDCGVNSSRHILPQLGARYASYACRYIISELKLLDELLSTSQVLIQLRSGP